MSKNSGFHRFNIVLIDLSKFDNDPMNIQRATAIYMSTVKLLLLLMACVQSGTTFSELLTVKHTHPQTFSNHALESVIQSLFIPALTGQPPLAI